MISASIQVLVDTAAEPGYMPEFEDRKVFWGIVAFR